MSRRTDDAILLNFFLPIQELVSSLLHEPNSVVPSITTALFPPDNVDMFSTPELHNAHNASVVIKILSTWGSGIIISSDGRK